MPAKQKTVWRVLQVAAGNFLEMYDFIIFGYYAAAIGKAYFPSDNDVASLMMTFTVFGLAYLIRPLGAILLGPYMDHYGRRRGLILTLGLMAFGTLTISCVPGYRAIGYFAPLIVMAGRLLQGLSAGVELGGVSVYLAEIATPGHRGFYVSWQSASQQVAVMFSAVLGLWLNSVLSPAVMDDWGWRIPLWVGCVIIPFLFLLRRSLQETEAFAARLHHPGLSEILRSVAVNWRLILIGLFMFSMSNTAFYMITTYTPTYGKTVLHLSQADAFAVTFCVGLSNLIFVPLAGALSDRIGRKPLLLGAAGLILATAYPALWFVVQVPTFRNLLLVELWLSVVYSAYNGGLIVYVTEFMPADVRTAGFSLAYSLSQAFFGGFTPLICTWAITVSGDKAMPGAWLSVAAVCGLSAVLVNWHRERSVRQFT